MRPQGAWRSCCQQMEGCQQIATAVAEPGWALHICTTGLHASVRTLQSAQGASPSWRLPAERSSIEWSRHWQLRPTSVWREMVGRVCACCWHLATRLKHPLRCYVTVYLCTGCPAPARPGRACWWHDTMRCNMGMLCADHPAQAPTSFWVLVDSLDSVHSARSTSGTQR